MHGGGAIESFLASQWRRGLSPGTIDHRRRHLRGLEAWLCRPIETATLEELRRFVDWRTRRVTPRTRYHWISDLAVFYRWAEAEGLIRADPTARLERPKLSEGLPRPIPDADLELALAGAPALMHCWLLLAAYAGLRCKEIGGIQREDILESYDPPTLVIRAPKGRRQRAVPLHPDVLMALRAFGLPRTGYVFRRPQGGRFPAYAVSHQINGYLHGLGIDSSAHCLRHWFGTQVYRLTKDLRLVQELMGHASPATTAIYTKLDQAAAAEAVCRLGRSVPRVRSGQDGG